MAQLALFPASQVLGWSVFKAPSWATRVQRSVSGREIRTNDYLIPLYTFTLTWQIMRDRWDLRQGPGDAYDPSGVIYDELRQIWNFFNQQQGANIPFYYLDYSDAATRSNPTVPQYVQFGVGDGVTTQWQLVSALLAPVVPTGVNGIYVNGVNIGPPPSSLYSYDDYGIITFATAPHVGDLLGADMSYFYKVRFADDNADAENFMYQLWRMKQLKLQSVTDSFLV